MVKLDIDALKTFFVYCSWVVIWCVILPDKMKYLWYYTVEGPKWKKRKTWIELIGLMRIYYLIFKFSTEKKTNNVKVENIFLEFGI